jgi:hypothetical protein
LDVVSSDSGSETCNETVLLAPGEGGEEWIIIQFNGLEVVVPVSPVVSLLRCGAIGDCVEGGKLRSQVVIFELTSGGIGQSLKSFGTCLGTEERRRASRAASERWWSRDRESATSFSLPANHWLYRQDS